MDRNTITGLVLIGLILSVFTIMNQPSEEEIKKQQKEVALQKKKEKEKEAKSKILQADKKVLTAGKGIKKTAVSASLIQKEDTIRFENEKLIIDFSTKGGKVASVYLKEFESYDAYALKTRKEKKAKNAQLEPLLLFKDGDAVNELVFPINGKTIKTGGLFFEVAEQTDNSITFVADLGDGQTIENVYNLKKDAYDIDYTVNMKGFGGKVSPNNVQFNWATAFRRSERLFSEQRRVSTICFDNKNEGLDYLSEMGDDDAVAEDEIEWIAYKQSYFSSIIRPEVPFSKQGTSFKLKQYQPGHERQWTHIKDFSSKASLGLKDVDNASIRMNWFFGPNDYETLKSYDQGYDDILNFGWGLFRWINIYAVQPLFNFLTNTGMGVGIAILMLTLILKFILMPIQWKMYTSSAKMRILKPEIDELNTKYPNKEDAMKKQMEMMTLYRESGASPLAGCVPMLIQMPILLAVFRFFPSAFELRQKPFLWAEDLSSYDSIWDFGVNIWPYGDHVSLFTLLMAGTTLIYTYLNSGNMQQPQQPGMPNMKVIMYIFPIMMIFFFNNYSSGLSYYYFISTLVSIIIMVLIKQFFVDEEKLKSKMAERKAAAANPAKAKKKSKFQERIEQMQKMQQEQMKNRKK
ncbi:MAG: membrane protein insertase YidC [Flavobacteriia bacterium]